MAEQETHTDPPDPPKRPLWRRLAAGIARLAGVLAALVVVVLLLIQTPWGAHQAAQLAFRAFNPFQGAVLNVGDVEGNFVTHLRFHDLTMVGDDGSTLVRVDTAALRYRLLDLLRLRFHATEIRLAHPDITMRQAADSTWDLLGLLPADTTAAKGRFRLRLDDVRLTDGQARLHYVTPGRPGYDSTVVFDDLNLHLRDVRQGAATSLRLDTLWTSIHLPGRTAPVQVRAGLTLRAGRFALTGFRLTSPDSDVQAHGGLSLHPDETILFDQADLTVQARPLAFSDLAPFIPALPPATTLHLDAHVTGSSDNLEAVLTADAGDGGTVDVAFEGTPRSSGTVVYRLDGKVRGLDLGRFAAGVDGRLNTDFRVNLAGPSVDRLDGRGEATLFDTRAAGYALDRTTLAATFDDGEAVLRLDTGLRGATLALSGTAHPFDDAPRYDLRGRLGRFNLAAFTDGGTQRSNLNATFTLAGIGLDPASADLYLTLDLAPSTLNTLAVRSGRFQATLNDGALGFATNLALPQGTVAARGNVGLGRDVLTYRVREGRFDQLPLMALLGDTTASRLTGTFALEGAGTEPSTLRLDARVHLEDSRYSTYTIHAADVDAHLNGGRLRLNGTADLDGGAATFAVTGQPFVRVPTFTVTEARLRDVDLGRLAPALGWSTHLNGVLTATMTGRDAASAALEAQLRLDASQVNDQVVNSARLDAALQAGTLTFDVDLDTPEGRTALAGTARPFDDDPRYTVERATLSGFNVGALLGQPAWQTDLNASITLNARGRALGTMALDAAVDVLPSRFNDQPLDTGRLEARLDNGLVHLDGRLQWTDGHLDLQADGRFFDARPTYTVTGRADNLNLARLLPGDSLETGGRLFFEAEGEGLDLRNMRLDGRLQALDVRYNTLHADTAYADVRLDGGVVRVDSLMLRTNVGRLNGRGPVALFDSLGTEASDFRFQAEVDNLAPLQPLLDIPFVSLEQGSVDGRLFGRPGRLRFDTRTVLDGFAYDDIRIAHFDGQVRGNLDPAGRIDRAEARFTADAFSLPSFIMDRGEVELDYHDDSLAFDVTAQVDEQRNGRLTGRVGLRDSTRVVVLERLDLQLQNERFRLLQEATLTVGEAYRISNFLIYTDNQQVALDGVVDLNGNQNLILTIEQLRTAPLADLFGYPDVGGVLNGYVDLTGPATAPQLSGSLDLNLIAFGRAVGRITTTLAYNAQQLEIDMRLASRDDNAILLNGTLPYDLSLAGTPPERLLPDGLLDVRMTADTFDVAWMRAFIDRSLVDRLAGRLTADIGLRGTPGAPQLRGEARLAEGQIGLPKLGRERGLVYRNLQADLTFDGDTVQVNHVEMHSGRRQDGTFVAHGTVALPQLTLGQFDIDMSAEDFLAIDSREYRATINANLALQGTTRQPLLTGQVDVQSADIHLTGETSASDFAAVQLLPSDERDLERYFGIRISEDDTTTFDFYQSLRIINLHVELQRDTWLRSKKSPTMDVQFTGDLDVRKTPFGELEVFGNIDVLPERSRIIQFGKQFGITRGTLTFNGPMLNPITDIEAQYAVQARESREQAITITMTVTGALSELDPLTLSSDPPMELTDMVSYIAFGQPASETLQLGGGTSAFLDPALGLAVSSLTNYLENVAGSSLGLDVLRFATDREGLKLTAGKYVRPRLYIAVTQPVSANSFSTGTSGSTAGDEPATMFIIEYELFERLLLRLQSGSVFRLNLQWEYAY